MELRQLRYFASVAREGSINKAARSHGLAQPALTKQLQRLEEELGVTLFERQPRGMTLTAAGTQFLQDVTRALDDLEAARQRAVDAAVGRLGHLAIGLTILHQLLPAVAEILRRFRQQSPDVSVSVRQVISGPQIDLIRAGELDAGFLYFRPADDPAFDGLLISTQQLALAVPDEPQWTDNPPRRLADLNGRDFLWIPRQVTAYYHDRLIAHFHGAGFMPKVVMEGTDNNSLLTLVTAGMGCAILPEQAAAQDIPSVKFLKLDDLDLRLPLELVWRRDNRSPITQRLIELTRQCVAEA
ncbi:LysR family transcriptional regulator [Cupriavidus pampae]|uniref:HTH-type transcriptional regulator TfdS n=1 Tax=Cupriavidus pampae TaxID=659251 RepID=A0ABM8WH35_9BURK|nr:LysR family transcriptional regulator [Cupriavidus pampae]CAG9166532.1 HTH-type transcriptional regulator TfdS [Cupriavidus pampae]